MRIGSDTMILQGGEDDIQLMTPSISVMKFVLHGSPQYSFPHSGFAFNPTKLLASPNDMFDGGSPPTPLNLTASALLSMGPLVWCAQSTVTTFLPGYGTYPMWQYPDGRVLPSPVYTTQSWYVSSYVAGHRALAIGDSMWYFGGFGSSNTATFPIALPTSVTANMNRMQYGPICTTIGTCGTTPCQRPDAAEGSICFLCYQGSYVVNNSGLFSCSFCAPGTYGSSNGLTACSKCPAGFALSTPFLLSLFLSFT